MGSQSCLSDGCPSLSSPSKINLRPHQEVCRVPVRYCYMFCDPCKLWAPQSKGYFKRRETSFNSTILASCLLLYPDHVWEARFEVTARKHTDMDNDLARIVRSIHMPPSANSLNWTYNGASRPKYLARDCSWDSHFVRRLDGHRCPKFINTKQCEAQVGTRNDMIQEGRLWYEFSLLPNCDLFTENKTLRLGEAAHCTHG